MGIKNVVKRVGNSAANRVSKLAVLSSDQVGKIQVQREEYLLKKPDPTDETARAMTLRMMAANSVEVFNSYLPQIKALYLPVKRNVEFENEKEFDTDHNIRYFNITKWVTDQKENSLEKLVNVYAVLSNEDCNIALIFNRTQENTNVFLAVVNMGNANSNTDVDNYRNRLIEAIRGNFPGAEWKDIDEQNARFGIGKLSCLDNDKAYSVAAASNIPTDKSEKFISQTIEKLLDGIVPDEKKKEYTLILLATPILDVEERKLRLGEIHSGLTPYASWSTNFTYTENHAQSSSATIGVNMGASAGVQSGQNQGITENESETQNEAETHSSSDSATKTTNESDTLTDNEQHSLALNDSETKTEGVSDTLGANFSVAIGVSESATVGGGIVPASAGITTNQQIGAGVTTGQTLSNNESRSIGKTATETLSRGISHTVGKSIAETTGTTVANTLGRAVTKGLAITSGVTKGTNFGANIGASFARSSTVTAMVGENEGITQNFENYNVKHALELLESQMKRLEQSTALGMWDFAAYVVSEDQNVANNVAHSYLALTLGEESYMSQSAVNLWRGEVDDEKEAAKEICDYLRELRHPLFALNLADEVTGKDEAYKIYPSIVTATTSLSGKELAYSLNFPQKSVSGLPILECAEFGRNVVTYDPIDRDGKRIELGKVFHMNHVEKNSVELSLESFKSHALITGSTGAGKSNTIYHILDRVRNAGAHFLVIEPAKGEYKNVFGKDRDVYVYGTNPMTAPLLRMNPFSFSKKVHILEHLDRLVEIFNVCWPMYAAMPAVLKSAVEKSYVECGWDLLTSVNRYDSDLYPGFGDVARNIKIIIDSSEYDSENKGAYKGALLTRLQSLTTGINGMLFSSDEISNEELFEKNVIVDLSRVGSSETKSLIMGMLVLKLQEFRMTEGIPMNADMRHVTVLEEAHNLLRRTSIEQPTESSNILGKSVEMIANAIAEMRTYGEGFIIADQAPGLMDMSVIRNTNTKIVMRLPDQGDRELVGKAANLNEEQIRELAKIPCGVAAVYQNEWVQPILCKVEKYDGDFSAYEFDLEENHSLFKKNDEVSDSLLKCIMDKELFQEGDKQDLRELKSMMIRSHLDSVVKVDFLEYLAVEKERGMESFCRLIYDFMKAEEAIQISTQYGDIHEWVDSVVDKLDLSVNGYSKKQIDLAIMLILQEKMSRDSSYEPVLNRFMEVYRNGGGVF